MIAFPAYSATGCIFNLILFSFFLKKSVLNRFSSPGAEMFFENYFLIVILNIKNNLNPICEQTVLLKGLKGQVRDFEFVTVV